MKKIGKLAINAEKVIKNEELVNLRGGGYGGDTSGPCTCTCFNADKFVETGETECYGYLFTERDCVTECGDFYGPWATGVCGNIYCD